MPKRILYVSVMATDTTDLDIRAIVSASTIWNRRHDITGLLVASRTHFAQVLEGPEAAVRSLYHRIEADPRHADPLVVGAGPIAARAFGAWSMGYIGPSPEIDARFAAITAEDRGAHAGPAVVALLLATLAGQAEAAALV